MFNKKSKALWAAIGLLTVGFVPQAFAVGTDAGETISNTATVSYQVGGVDQEDVDSNEETFVVDRVIRMTLALDGNLGTAPVPGATSKITSYTLTNTSNAPLDFDLDAINAVNGDLVNPGPTNIGTDDQEGTNIIAFLDTNGNGVYDVGTDSLRIEDLGADDSVNVLVSIDIPSSVVDGETIGVVLTATATETNGDPLSQDTGANTSGMETIFGDATGVTDSDYDGKISVYGAYSISGANLSVAKSSTVIDDYVSSSNFKAIPGALVEYCIVVTNSNTATADATDVTVSDGVPLYTSFEASSVATGSGTTCGSSADAPSLGDESGGTVTATFPTVSPGESVWVSFQVTID
ncbi:hypothetical protein [Microbulbifer elongatus]|uniref:hypothetical protein n=1 Tax=Microbulbifer elongatus TaxID=86173 RepID=UPI001CFEA6BF|nr:hypothetical protein [Microbulbifer elongatus]